MKYNVTSYQARYYSKESITAVKLIAIGLILVDVVGLNLSVGGH
jgi:multidrug transporter EmrE-like cation transporter